MTIRKFQDKSPVIGERVYVDPQSAVIGDVTLGDDVSIWPMVAMRGDVHWIKIGARTNVQDNSVLHVTHYGKYNPTGTPLSIGDDVTIGHSATVHACTIKDRCLIGMGSIILDDVVIDSDVMLGAGSLVPPGKILESGYLWLGNPVKRVRKLSDEEIEFLKYSAEHYVRLKDKYL